MVSASTDIASAVEAMKLGAFDYISKPFDKEELRTLIAKALEKRSLVRENLYLKESLNEATSYYDLIGKTPQMKELYRAIDSVAATNSTILITGESGTGKELVARAIHKKGKRSAKPFIAVNCAAIPDNLLESELFGHERGSFTGAMERKLGKFELADSGTLFLDEIGCMPAAMQAKLLRVLEGQVIERVGSEKGIPVDVRIISATNIDFEKHIKEGKFRHDLYYRLNVIPVSLAPLRERKEDIPLFVDYFLDKYNKSLN
jgi:DNA-binding NtrC family response regulator